ncbi:invasion associated locus B family protein [Cognatishimia sp. 1_MG-2023]|uniref:invasion associated locus B family protein n=1 Tax=Cognatishimia sp. 1_MG-2023 TaxID=3062642 RepID=UPI0026E1C945|nr:invasion associated locus B family protein [Cognatishimia sp. 1_MG-2023]MDO6725329.1 invasion associated locus B family protein [Cognatishimia sp. 1_MG-2023]
MLKNIQKIVLAAAFAAATPVIAQEATTADPGLSTGEDLKNPAPEVRSETIGDWTVNCQILAEGENCQMTQLLLDSSETPVIEVNFFPVPASEQVFAGGSIMAPLQTLLTSQMTIAIDDALAKRYPFAFCMPAGCVARVGLTKEDVAAYKKGNEANVTIVPAGAPDKQVRLKMSLTGFTKAFDTMSGKK